MYIPARKTRELPAERKKDSCFISILIQFARGDSTFPFSRSRGAFARDRHLVPNFENVSVLAVAMGDFANLAAHTRNTTAGNTAASVVRNFARRIAPRLARVNQRAMTNVNAAAMVIVACLFIPSRIYMICTRMFTSTCTYYLWRAITMCPMCELRN